MQAGIKTKIILISDLPISSIQPRMARIGGASLSSMRHRRYFSGKLLGSRLLVVIPTLFQCGRITLSLENDLDLIDLLLFLISSKTARQLSTNNVLHKSVVGICASDIKSVDVWIANALVA